MELVLDRQDPNGNDFFRLHSDHQIIDCGALVFVTWHVPWLGFRSIRLSFLCFPGCLACVVCSDIDLGALENHYTSIPVVTLSMISIQLRPPIRRYLCVMCASRVNASRGSHATYSWASQPCDLSPVALLRRLVAALLGQLGFRCADAINNSAREPNMLFTQVRMTSGWRTPTFLHRKHGVSPLCLIVVQMWRVLHGAVIDY